MINHIRIRYRYIFVASGCMLLSYEYRRSCNGASYKNIQEVLDREKERLFWAESILELCEKNPGAMKIWKQRISFADDIDIYLYGIEENTGKNFSVHWIEPFFKTFLKL